MRETDRRKDESLATLRLPRITRGLLKLRRERVDLATIVRHAVETSHPLVQAGGYRQDVSLPGEAL